MEAVLINVVGIVTGTLVGLLFKGLLSKSVQNKIEMALGFCTLLIAIKMALKFDDVFCLIGSVVVGGIVGTWIHLEQRIEALGKQIQARLGRLGKGEFAKGFTISSVLYCTGAMAIIGPINAGLMGDHEILYAKTMLDGIISISFAAIYGIGVAFSALTVLLYQGTIVFLASKMEVLTQPSAIADISGVGGVLVMMIGVNLIGLKKIAVGDFLPGMLIVILVHAFFGH